MTESKRTEMETIKVLENNTKEIETFSKIEAFQSFKKWVDVMNREELKGVIIGCATFILINSNSRLFAKNKEDKKAAKFRKNVASSYINYAQSVFYTL